MIFDVSFQKMYFGIYSVLFFSLKSGTSCKSKSWSYMDTVWDNRTNFSASVVTFLLLLKLFHLFGSVLHLLEHLMSFFCRPLISFQWPNFIYLFIYTIFPYQYIDAVWKMNDSGLNCDFLKNTAWVYAK